MGQAGFDLLLHILLNLCPFFWFGGRILGDEWTKVSGINGGEDSALREGVKVVRD